MRGGEWRWRGWGVVVWLRVFEEFIVGIPRVSSLYDFQEVMVYGWISPVSSSFLTRHWGCRYTVIGYRVNSDKTSRSIWVYFIFKNRIFYKVYFVNTLTFSWYEVRPRFTETESETFIYKFSMNYLVSVDFDTCNLSGPLYTCVTRRRGCIFPEVPICYPGVLWLKRCLKPLDSRKKKEVLPCWRKIKGQKHEMEKLKWIFLTGTFCVIINDLRSFTRKIVF